MFVAGHLGLSDFVRGFDLEIWFGSREDGDTFFHSFVMCFLETGK